MNEGTPFLNEKQLKMLRVRFRCARPLARASAALIFDCLQEDFTCFSAEVLETNPYIQKRYRVWQECIKEMADDWNGLLKNIETNRWQDIIRLRFFDHYADEYTASKILKELVREDEIRNIYEFMTAKPGLAKMLLENDTKQRMADWREKHPGRRETGYYYRGIIGSYGSVCAFCPLTVTRDENGRFDADAWDLVFMGDKITTAVVGVILDGDNSERLFMPCKEREEILECVGKNDWRHLCDKYFPDELTPQQSVPLEQALENFNPQEFHSFFSHQTGRQSIGALVVRAEPALNLTGREIALDYVARTAARISRRNMPMKSNNDGNGRAG